MRAIIHALRYCHATIFARRARAKTMLKDENAARERNAQMPDAFYASDTLYILTSRTFDEPAAVADIWRDMQRAKRYVPRAFTSAKCARSAATQRARALCASIIDDVY